MEDVIRKEVATEIANNGFNRSGIEIPAPLPDLLPPLRTAPTVDGRELIGSKGALEYSKGRFDQARDDLRERLDLAIRAGVAERLADPPASRTVAPVVDHPLAIVGERAVDRLASASGGAALPLMMAAGAGAAAGYGSYKLARVIVPEKCEQVDDGETCIERDGKRECKPKHRRVCTPRRDVMAAVGLIGGVIVFGGTLWLIWRMREPAAAPAAHAVHAALHPQPVVPAVEGPEAALTGDVALSGAFV
jgi:hypothetical protein